MARKTKEEAAKTRLAIIQAGRRVFYQRGVVRSTFENVAAEAGVTRGAVYYYFSNKAELFFAMREDVLEAIREPVDKALFSSGFSDPLDAIEAGLTCFFRVFDESPVVREMFEIMMTRCEYVDEFAGIQEEVARPGREFLEKIERVYRLAAHAGSMRDDLDPQVAARDTWAFADGLLHLVVGRLGSSRLERRIPALVQAHVALRRA